MPYTAFHEYFPKIAERETRTLTVFKNNDWDLPAADYSLIEMFCDEPGCDCQRVMFYVTSSKTKNVAAVIAYGWESEKFYRKWFGYKVDSKAIQELKGPALNALSPQSKIAPQILQMVVETVLQDDVYIERVKRHYKMFREIIETQLKDKNFANDPMSRLERAMFPEELSSAKASIDRNAPCPCGSGKKYKKCCMLRNE